MPPESDKSATQKLSDTARSGTDDTQAKTGGIAETVSKNVTAAKDTVTQTASGQTPLSRMYNLYANTSEQMSPALSPAPRRSNSRFFD